MFKVLTVVAVLLLAVAAFCYRPATILGVDGDALAYSVGGTDSECTWRGEHWRCLVPDASGSGVVDYIVETHSFGCWDATRRGVPGTAGVTRKVRRTISTFSCDIAYSDSPAASRASPLSRNA